MTARQFQNRRAVFHAKKDHGGGSSGAAGPCSYAAVASSYQIAGFRQGGKSWLIGQSAPQDVHSSVLPRFGPSLDCVDPGHPNRSAARRRSAEVASRAGSLRGGILPATVATGAVPGSLPCVSMPKW